MVSFYLTQRNYSVPRVAKDKRLWHFINSKLPRHERIVDADSLSKDQIYKIVKSWGVDAFKSQKDVTQADDREVGIIAFKSFFEISFWSPILHPDIKWQYSFTMKSI